MKRLCGTAKGDIYSKAALTSPKPPGRTNLGREIYLLHLTACGRQNLGIYDILWACSRMVLTSLERPANILHSHGVLCLFGDESTKYKPELALWAGGNREHS